MSYDRWLEAPYQAAEERERAYERAADALTGEGDGCPSCVGRPCDVCCQAWLARWSG
jgi:hypothetical protein